MKKLIITAIAVVSLCGCMNLYTRFPTTDAEIKSVYQCSREAAGMAIICSFPQAMSDCPGDSGWMWENLLTIPFLGLPCAVDAVCEACIDTVCLPFDWPMSAMRSKEGK